MVGAYCTEQPSNRFYSECATPKAWRFNGHSLRAKLGCLNLGKTWYTFVILLCLLLFEVKKNILVAFEQIELKVLQ